jgi:cell division transport system permease protein
MNITSFGRIIKLGLVNFWRNRLLSLAATLVMTLTLLITTIFIFLPIVINTATNALKQKIDLVIYFRDDKIPDEKIQNLKTTLETREDVIEVTYVSKEEARKRWEQMPIKENIRSQVTDKENPLPRTLKVKPGDPENLQVINNYLTSPDLKTIICQDCISFEKNKNLVEKLINYTKGIRKLGMILSVVLITISVIVILNTIRLTIITRKDEIEIMKLVGATESFIRIPFILEGALYGILATIFSTIIIKIGILYLHPNITRYLSDLSFNLEVFFNNHLWQIIGLQLIMGIFIGTVCSIFSIRRHLKI